MYYSLGLYQPFILFCLKLTLSNFCYFLSVLLISSSDGESSSLSEEHGISPPLDIPFCWLPVSSAQGFPRPTSSEHHCGHMCINSSVLRRTTRSQPSLMTRVLSRASPFPTLEIKSSRNSCFTTITIEDEEQVNHRVRDLEHLAEEHLRMFNEQREFHLRRQFCTNGLQSNVIDGNFDLSSLSLSDGGDSLARRLFPDPELTYGRLYTEPSPQELRVFAR